MTREETLKGLECCAEFLCDECPYKIYAHIDYKLRCNYKLIVDLKAIMSKTGIWKLGNYGFGTCSECKFTQASVWDYDNFQNYCGHCGAKMSLED